MLGLTAEFERAVGISVREFAVEKAPNNVPQIGEFRKLTELFERDVINAVLIGDPHEILGLHDTYSQNVQRILSSPDTIPELMTGYTLRFLDKLGIMIKWKHLNLSLNCYFK